MKVIIYQENDPMFRVDKDKKVYDKSTYHMVYEREEDRNGREDKKILEDLFWEFNIGGYPKEYQGHSLSVGDIIEFRPLAEFEKGSDKYICDRFGWNKVEWK